MLDTNTVSYILKGISEAARARLVSLNSEQVACISCITEGELWYGLARIGAGERRSSALHAFLGRLKVLPWDSEAAAAYGALRAKQEAKGGKSRVTVWGKR